MALCLSGVILALAFTQISSSQTTKQYDPWLDYNDDGRIDMRDIGMTCMAFGTTGDPAKPVIINHNWQEGNFSFNLGLNKYVSLNITTVGFRIVTIRILAYSIDAHKFQLTIMPKVTGSICNRLDYAVSSHTPFIPAVIPYPPWQYVQPANFKETYEVAFSELMVGIYNNSTSRDLWGTVYYYLTT